MENDELASYLDSIARFDDFRVDAILKQTDVETTEVVYFPGASGSELGPFIRKRISSDGRFGNVYKEIFDAQKAGRRFKYLPRMQDVYEQGHELIVLMEYINGKTLQERVRDQGVDLDFALDAFPRLCNAVQELHEGFANPIIHRDLKPSNVIVNGENLVIIDFGISRTYKEDATTDTSHFGTRAYAPPEQFGYGQTDVKSDVYALGLILYFLLSGVEPNQFTVTNGFSEVPYDAMRDVLKKATAFDPAMRYQSVSELKSAVLLASKCLTQATPATESTQPHPVSYVNQPYSNQPYASQPYRNQPSAGQPMPVFTDTGAGQRPIATSSKASIESYDTMRATSSEIVGLIWDCCVGFVWILAIIACLAGPFSPSGESAFYPLWFRIVEFWAGGIPMMSGILYAMVDKRWLRRHVPFMRSQTYGKSLITALIMFGIGFAVICLMSVILFATNTFGMGDTISSLH